MRKGDLIVSVRFRNLLVASVVFAVVGVGVLIGRQVGAAGVDPGSQGDPLVARSYVDSKLTAISDRLAKLENDVAALLKNGGQSQSPSPAPTVKRGTVNGDYVNIRSGSSTGYKVLAVVTRGTSAEVLGSQNGWYQIKLANGAVGWIAGWLFTVQ